MPPPDLSAGSFGPRRRFHGYAVDGGYECAVAAQPEAAADGVILADLVRHRRLAAFPQLTTNAGIRIGSISDSTEWTETTWFIVRSLYRFKRKGASDAYRTRLAATTAHHSRIPLGGVRKVCHVFKHLRNKVKKRLGSRLGSTRPLPRCVIFGSFYTSEAVPLTTMDSDTLPAL